MVPLPPAGAVGGSCPEVIDTSSKDTIEFLGPDPSALFGGGTPVTKPHVHQSWMDAEVYLELGEQAADVHVLPLGEELQRAHSYILGSVSAVPVQLPHLEPARSLIDGSYCCACCIFGRR